MKVVASSWVWTIAFGALTTTWEDITSMDGQGVRILPADSLPFSLTTASLAPAANKVSTSCKLKPKPGPGSGLGDSVAPSGCVVVQGLKDGGRPFGFSLKPERRGTLQKRRPPKKGNYPCWGYDRPDFFGVERVEGSPKEPGQNLARTSCDKGWSLESGGTLNNIRGSVPTCCSPKGHGKLCLPQSRP